MNYLKQLIGQEQAEQILRTYSVRELSSHPEYLANAKGVGPKTLMAIQTGMELARQGRYEAGRQITSPREVADYVMAQGLDVLDQEELWLLPLDTKNRFDKHLVIYRGTVNTSVIRIPEIIRPCVLKNSTAFIIIHNHPSGDPTPSPEDVKVSNRIKEAAMIFQIELLDSIIVGHGNWKSLKELGLLKDSRNNELYLDS